MREEISSTPMGVRLQQIMSKIVKNNRLRILIKYRCERKVK